MPRAGGGGEAASGAQPRRRSPQRGGCVVRSTAMSLRAPDTQPPVAPHSFIFCF